MASAKEYGYFIKGNKLALIEKDTALDNDVNSRDYGPDVTNVRFKSPLSSVTDGIELEYAHIPTWHTTSGTDTTGQNRRFVSAGYGFTNGDRLSFIIPEYDFTATGGTTDFVAGERILIQDSNVWNGIHEIANVWNGILVTTTRNVGYDGSITIVCDFTTTTITGNTSHAKTDINEYFPSGTHYVFVGGTSTAADAENENSLYKVTSDGAGTLTPTAQYTVTNSIVTENTSPVLAAETGDTVALLKVFYDPTLIYQKLSFLEMVDESFDIDITRYQSRAIVYYLKAKSAEDRGDFQLKDLMMREFYRIVEKSDNAKIHTIRRVAPSSAAIR
jgi:hypothetical protein